MSQIKEVEMQLTEQRLLLSMVENTVTVAIESGLSRRPETTLSLRSVQLASMWLGKAKGAIGSKDPYPDSRNPKNTVIENREDVLIGQIELPEDVDEVTAIKTLRKKLKEIELAIRTNWFSLNDRREYQQCIANAWTNCSNAGMWLGMVLNTIKVNTIKELSGAAVKEQKQPIVGSKEPSPDVPPVTTSESLPKKPKAPKAPKQPKTKPAPEKKEEVQNAEQSEGNSSNA